MSTSNRDSIGTMNENGTAAAVTGRPSLSAPAANPIPQSDSSPVAEKRGAPRYKCEGSAEFRTDGFEVRTWARMTDLSRSGCYIEMQATSPLNTAVSLMIEVNGLRLHVKGAVKTSYAMQGMGVAFAEIPDTDLLQLDEIIRQLASGPSETPEPQPSAGPDLLTIIDASAALNAVANFFQSHRMLTREEFKDLVGTSQNRNEGRDR
jgi:PilZ domain